MSWIRGIIHNSYVVKTFKWLLKPWVKPRVFGRDGDVIALAYQMILGRLPDDDGLKHYSEMLRRGDITQSGIFEALFSSNEFLTKPYFDSTKALHASRVQFIKSLPKAELILDLGGVSVGSPDGALITMGYPYQFKKLTIVDLPSDDRHTYYRDLDRAEQVDTSHGKVEYVYHCMSDLERYPDNCFDLVFSGETIEHISEIQADKVLKNAFRILKPGGWFCLDTPNRKATKMHNVGLTNPDHKIEYTHAKLRQKILAAGFQIKEQKGLTYLGNNLNPWALRFSYKELSKHAGIFSDIENCYLLAYVCQKPD